MCVEFSKTNLEARMFAVNPELARKFKNARKILSEDSTDSKTEFDVREDEEQSVKLQEIIDILVAAGYFRARIKGLSSFDKVIGGMVWCIESCNVDLDVDLLFKENLSIGQKIALTEKIVAVLPKLKCPRTIEPHQIQGLDFINIFPVIQWLVKKSLERRQEVASFVRACAVDQFNKTFHVLDKNHTKHSNLIENLKFVSEVYRPHRFYRRENTGQIDAKSQIHLTLVEYGHSDGNLKDIITAEEHKIADFNDDYRSNLNKHYTTLQLELNDAGMLSREQAIIESLEEKKQIFDEKCSDFIKQDKILANEIKLAKTDLEELREKKEAADKSLQELNIEDQEDAKLKQIEELIILNDDLKAQEAKFKEHCKKELDNLNKLIEDAKKAKVKVPTNQNEDLSEEIEEATQNIRTLRIKLAKVNREVAHLQRSLDDVPKRAELAQYQKRFVELYNQMAVKHKETKQYYTLYNTLEDTRLWMKKELSILNSISDSYPEAMTSWKSKEEFLDQFQNIIENVRSSKSKIEQKLETEKQTRDQLSNTLHGLVEQQRKYVMAIKQLGVECKKQENLIKMQG
ncbi:unnamed protein product [Phyllotreta striolata]|uniref:Coiled-coil domain-containing protein 93 n=1 Tax=Phyllotreta striolata TaxID=444603 RepID=A0A9N9XSG2_PHYSR|nr:unnamed protein product [Phyllotreta striolata]